MKPNLSLIIITYNRADDTLELLKSLKAQNNWQTFLGEILLLNNNSSDSYENVEVFIAENPDFPIVYFNHDENLGVARGRNFLIQRANYPLLFVMDDDMILPDLNSFHKASTLLDNDLFKSNNVAVVTTSVFYFDTNERQKNTLPHKKYEKYKDKHQFLTYFFAGGAHIIKKEVFDKTGLYPENFFYGMEEYDLSYRIINCGYKLAYDSSIKILHKESPLGRTTDAKKREMMWYNKSVVAWKYLPNRFFYSTVAMWGFHYLFKTKFDLKNAIRILKRIMCIPKEIKPQKISQISLDYLRSVEARLWY